MTREAFEPAVTEPALPPDFIPLRKPWSSLAMLRDVTRSDLETAGDFDEAAELLLFDMNTEYDAMNLSDFFKRQMAAGGLELTPEFLAFCEAWLADEWNHYEGYRLLYGLCTGRTAEDLHREVVARPANFEPILDFIRDEFSICMVIAYDEFFTVRSCTQDFPLFESFGKPYLLDWIKLVARDEGYHYRNAMEVIRRRHADRIPEAPAFIDRLIEWDLQGGGDYGATFVLDHEESRYTRDELIRIKQKILALLDRQDPLDD
ncbi:MAG: hypothetical protein Tsb0019_10570 [Roseibium sp.]